MLIIFALISQYNWRPVELGISVEGISHSQWLSNNHYPEPNQSKFFKMGSNFFIASTLLKRPGNYLHLL